MRRQREPPGGGEAKQSPVSKRRLWEAKLWNLAAGTEPPSQSFPLSPSPSVVVQQKPPSPRLEPLQDTKGEIEPQTSEPPRGLEPSIHCWGSVPRALFLLGLKQSQHLEKETDLALRFMGRY